MSNESNEANGGAATKTATFELPEETPLLFGREASGISTSVHSTTSTTNLSSRQRDSVWAFSGHWLNTASYHASDRFQSERERAVGSGIVRAAFLIRDAVLGESENPSEGTYDPYEDPQRKIRNFLSLVFRQILSLRSLRHLMRATVWILALLSFVEPPRWCRGHCHQVLYMVGPPAIGDGNDTSTDEIVDYYPNTHSIILGDTHSVVIEWICIIVISIFLLFRVGRDGCSIWRYLRPGPAQKIRAVQIAMLIILLVGLLQEEQAVLQPFARLILLASFVPSVQQEMTTLVRLFPEVFNILLILVIFTVFWAFLGVVGFYDTREGEEDFSNLWEGMWTLFIMITTANYPDVMMPAYNNNRLVALYFVLFMILSFFFMMNLILASVVNSYDEALNSRKKIKKDCEDAKLTEAYKLMDPENRGLSKDTIMTLFRILNKDFPEFRQISTRDAKLLYAVLDRDGSGIINLDEFLDFGSILLLEFREESDYITMVEQRFPKIYNASSYQNFVQAVKSDNFERTIDIILVLNAVVVVCQSYPFIVGNPTTLDEHYMDGSIDTIWELIEAIFTAIYCLEASAKILALGWNSYSQTTKNIFDFVITVLALAATVYVYYPNQFSDSRLIRYIVMARVLRLLRLMISLKPFRLIGVIWYEIIPCATTVICFLFFLMYFFAALGLELYGGMVTRDPSNPQAFLILNTSFSDNEYWANNFNDMMGGMNVLFNLLVINNWTECEEGFEAVTGHKWVRFFFFAFYIAGVVLVNNLVIAFFINAFLVQKKIMANRKDRVEVEGEAVIHGREARFDATKITGTTTSLRGGFIARIRSNDAEEDEQDRLRRLFTQTSDDLRYHEKEDDPDLYFVHT